MKKTPDNILQDHEIKESGIGSHWYDIFSQLTYNQLITRDAIRLYYFISQQLIIGKLKKVVSGPYEELPEISLIPEIYEVSTGSHHP